MIYSELLWPKTYRPIALYLVLNNEHIVRLFITRACCQPGIVATDMPAVPADV